jgi:hypothetical protein
MSNFCTYCGKPNGEYHASWCKLVGKVNPPQPSSGDALLSAVVGYATDSAILGTIVGGSVTGAILGDLFGDGDLFD